MTTSPYIHFQGNCAEALAFYAEVFGGSDLQTMLYADAPDARPEWTGSPRVMHGQVRLGDQALMASDYPPGVEGAPQAAVSVMQSVADTATGAQVFARLAEGGGIIQPWGPTFFAEGFGMVKDRFGTHWMIWAGPTGG